MGTMLPHIKTYARYAALSVDASCPKWWQDAAAGEAGWRCSFLSSSMQAATFCRCQGGCRMLRLWLH